MTVKLLAYTPDPDVLAGQAAAKCTRARNTDKARDRAMASGHESVAEHASFTFEVNDVSRVLLAQLTRHRMASYSVESQRYCNQSDAQSIIPPSIMNNETARLMTILHLDAGFQLYDQLVQMDIPEEDARYVLHQGIGTNLILTMNARELRHFFSLRCCNRAQWEIRAMADKMLEECKKVAPALFADAGPGCVRGGCPESRPCGHPRVEVVENG